MDLALNDLQWLICHKTKPNNIAGGWILPQGKNMGLIVWSECKLSSEEFGLGCLIHTAVKLITSLGTYKTELIIFNKKESSDEK